MSKPLSGIRESIKKSPFFNSASNPIFITDLKGVIIAWNHFFSTYFLKKSVKNTYFSDMFYINFDFSYFEKNLKEDKYEDFSGILNFSKFDSQKINFLVRKISLFNETFLEFSMKEYYQEELSETLDVAYHIYETLTSSLEIENPYLAKNSYFKPSFNIGGDIYFSKEIENKLFIVLADVAGHGIASSLIASVFRMLLPLYKLKKNDLHTFPIFLKNHLKDILPSNRFITLFACIIDMDHKTLSFVNCGNPAPILWDAKNKTNTFLKSDSAPLSILLENTASTQEIPLPEEGALLFYSDGIFNYLPEKNAVPSLLKKWNVVIHEQNINIPKSIYLDLKESFCSPQMLEDDISLSTVCFLKKSFAKSFTMLSEISAMKDNIRIIQKHIKITIDPFEVSTQKWDQMIGALYEALINSVEHGNHSHILEKVTLRYHIFFKKEAILLAFKITDSGNGFDTKKYLSQVQEINSNRGRGITLIQYFSNAIRYNKKGNSMLLLFKIDKK